MFVLILLSLSKSSTPASPWGPFISEVEARTFATLKGWDPECYVLRPLTPPEGGIHDRRYLAALTPAEADGPCKSLQELRFFRHGRELTHSITGVEIEGGPHFQSMEIWFCPSAVADLIVEEANDGWRMKDIGLHLDISESRVSQIAKRGMFKLRQSLGPYMSQ